jgi:hypothetical protein
MISLLKSINLVLYLVLEISMLVALGYWGYLASGHLFWRYVLAISLPFLIALLWGLLAAPSSAHRLTQPSRAIFALVLLSISAFSIYRTGHFRLAISFEVAAFISQSLALQFKQ